MAGTAPKPLDLHVGLVSRRPAVHALFREAARRADTMTVEVVDVPPSGLAGAPALDRASVVVIDISLELASGVDLCPDLHAGRPTLPLVALVCCPQCLSPWHLRALLDGILSGVLDLESTPEDVWRIVNEAAQGAFVLHLHVRPSERSFLRKLVASRELTRATTVRLLELVASGLPDHELGRRIHLSPHTVKHRIENLREELGVRNRIELAAWAGQHGFYAPERARPVPEPSLVLAPPQRG